MNWFYWFRLFAKQNESHQLYCFNRPIILTNIRSGETIICIMQLQSVRNFLVIYRPRAKSSKIFINTNNTILNLLSNLYLLFARIRILFYFVCESSWTMTKAHQHQLRKWLCLLLHILILLLLKFYNIVIIYWRYILIR